MHASNDGYLSDWLWGVIEGRPVPAGGFLRSIADAAVMADAENYALMRPMLLELAIKYPKYSFKGGFQA